MSFLRLAVTLLLLAVTLPLLVVTLLLLAVTLPLLAVTSPLLAVTLPLLAVHYATLKLLPPTPSSATPSPAPLHQWRSLHRRAPTWPPSGTSLIIEILTTFRPNDQVYDSGRHALLPLPALVQGEPCSPLPTLV